MDFNDCTPNCLQHKIIQITRAQQINFIFIKLNRSKYKSFHLNDIFTVNGIFKYDEKILWCFKQKFVNF